MKALRMTVMAALLLAMAGPLAARQPPSSGVVNDAIGYLRGKAQMNSIASQYGSDPNSYAYLGEVLIAAAEAARYGAQFPASSGGGGSVPAGLLARIEKLEGLLANLPANIKLTRYEQVEEAVREKIEPLGVASYQAKEDIRVINARLGVPGPQISPDDASQPDRFQASMPRILAGAGMTAVALLLLVLAPRS